MSYSILQTLTFTHWKPPYLRNRQDHILEGRQPWSFDELCLLPSQTMSGGEGIPFATAGLPSAWAQQMNLVPFPSYHIQYMMTIDGKDVFFGCSKQCGNIIYPFCLAKVQAMRWMQMGLQIPDRESGAAQHRKLCLGGSNSILVFTFV